MRQECSEPPTKKFKEDTESKEDESIPDDLTTKISEDKTCEESILESSNKVQERNEESTAPDQGREDPRDVRREDDPEMEEKRKEFEKMIDDYDFPYDISKCGKKKMIKKMKFEFFKKIKRKREKEKIKEKWIRRLQEDPSAVREKVKITKMSESSVKTRIAIDCSFDSLMTENDVQKLSKQMQRCYTLNRKMANPLQLYYTHVQDKTLERFDAAMDGYRNWDANFKSESLAELFPLSEVVYLCAESETVIQTLDDDKIYVIGGFVDHNSHKGVGFDRAVKSGFSTARLPIDDYFKLSTRKVLTVCQVFEIIANFSRSGCWKEAIRETIPKRKGLEEHGVKGEGEKGEEVKGEVTSGSQSITSSEDVL